jgi:hypothetical protein
MQNYIMQDTMVPEVSDTNVLVLAAGIELATSRLRGERSTD